MTIHEASVMRKTPLDMGVWSATRDDLTGSESEKERSWCMVFTNPPYEVSLLQRNRYWSSSYLRTSTGSISRILEALSELKDYRIEMPQLQGVISYLREHEDMLGLVSAVCRVARTECFPNGTQLSLELYHDPEIEDEYLTLYVRQEEYNRDTLRKIKAILSGYGEMLAGKSGWLLVTTDFEQPI